MRSFRLSWCRDYGIDRRRGWSVSIDGIVWVQLERSLVVALARASWRWLRSEGECVA